LDISAHALAGAKRNFQLNHSIVAVAGCPHETVQADTFEWLAAAARGKFGLIVLDPPSFAKREPERAGALRAYGRLAALGINALGRDGILMAASCSAHVSAEEFFEAVRHSAASSGRRFSELQTTLHAPDHPANCKEMEYLKAIFLKVS
jgi:23S rRNA (cytosine1962-C5)-methyltransferase